MDKEGRTHPDIVETSGETWLCGKRSVIFSEVRQYGIGGDRRSVSLGWRFTLYARGYVANFWTRNGSPWKTLKAAKMAARGLLRSLGSTGTVIRPEEEGGG